MASKFTSEYLPDIWVPHSIRPPTMDIPLGGVDYSRNAISCETNTISGHNQRARFRAHTHTHRYSSAPNGWQWMAMLILGTIMNRTGQVVINRLRDNFCKCLQQQLKLGNLLTLASRTTRRHKWEKNALRYAQTKQSPMRPQQIITLLITPHHALAVKAKHLISMLR